MSREAIPRGLSIVHVEELVTDREVTILSTVLAFVKRNPPTLDEAEMEAMRRRALKAKRLWFGQRRWYEGRKAGRRGNTILSISVLQDGRIFCVT